jgi:uncharacterized repeat protein (TIGR03803 family)
MASTWKERALLGFNNLNGATPTGALIFGANGNLYGTTSYGGDLTCAQGIGCGVVFELTATSNGGWKETILYRFKGGNDGSIPDEYATLIFDDQGNLYGTTSAGGGSTACDYGGFSGCGTVFELTPTSSGPWKEKILYRFNGGNGSLPQGGLVFDQQGNLYGTTSVGGGSQNCGVGVGCGVVFEVANNGNGTWNGRALHIFNGAPKGCQNCDGDVPLGTLALDIAGNLYGTSTSGGINNQGTVFELSPTVASGWKYRTIYSFQGVPDGAEPFAGVTLDQQGNLYGTTVNGGTGTVCPPDCGTVFELSPSAGNWTETTLYNFLGGADGAEPLFPLLFDAVGNIYGSTTFGGANPNCTINLGPGGCGTAFELTPSASGIWTETLLFLFNETDAGPQNLIFDSQGNLYGTSVFGGRAGCSIGNCGIVFELFQ